MDKVALDALPVGKSRLVLIGNLLRPRRFPSLAGRGEESEHQFALGLAGVAPQGTAVMVQLLYSPWLAHMILGSFAVSIVASLKISVAFLSHSVFAASIDVSGDGVKVGPRAEISLSAHSSAAACMTGSTTVSAAARHKEERKIEAIFGIGSLSRSNEG